MSTHKQPALWMTRQRIIAACLVAVVLLCMQGLSASESTGVVQQSICKRGDTVHRIELRGVAEIQDACEILHEKMEEGVMERTLHEGRANSAFCQARFSGHVASLAANGWSCSATIDQTAKLAAPSSEVFALGEVANEASKGRSAKRSSLVASSPASEEWRTECQASLALEDTEAGGICDCALDVLDSAGFVASDYDLLISPYRRDQPSQPVHRAGLLYAVGMMAVDALAQCGGSADD